MLTINGNINFGNMLLSEGLSLMKQSKLFLVGPAISAALLTGVFLTANADTTTTQTATGSLPVAQDFSATTIDGMVFNLGEANADKTVVLEWSNHDCPFVVKHYATPPANMQTLQAREDEDSVTWVTIVSSAEGKQGHITAEKAAELTTSRGAAPDHIILDTDGTIGRLYGAKTTPHMFIVDDGKLAYQGAIDSVRSARVKDIEKADNYVATALDAIAAGTAPSPADTKPYGCSVKY